MGQSTLVQHVQQFATENRLLQRGERIIAAVSGGIDSCVLLDVLLRLRETWNLGIVVAHFNHQLRGQESDEDEQFVRSLCTDRKVEFYIERANTSSVAEMRRVSVQEAARDLRYEFFNKVRASGGFDKIATAHNADDNAETVLFNILRGGGVSGMVGIQLHRKDLSVVRPLLKITREQIEEYARERRLPYRIDSSNIETEYTRNFLRASVIPLLRENVNPNLVGTLGRMAAIFGELNEYLHAEAGRIGREIIIHESPVEIVFDIPKLHAQPVFLQEQLLLLSAKRFTHRSVEFPIVKAMSRISRAPTGTSVQIAPNTVVVRDRERLLLRKTSDLGAFSYKVMPERAYDFDHFHFSSSLVEQVGDDQNGNVEYVDADRLSQELTLRNWTDGDWFQPLGMKGKKKVSDFFVDEKIPIYEKHSIPVLESDGAIVWICGRRIDDRFKITPKTKRILKLKFMHRDAGAG